MTAGPTILVVEDERVVARDIQRSLSDLGYHVPATAASGAQALELASASRPDLVLMDIQIKGAVDGIETARALRERFGVPVVYLTAFADAATVERAKGTEPFGYLLKPVKAKELRSAVEIALYKHDIERRLRQREEWLATVLGSIGDGVVSLGADGRVELMNAAAAAMTGWAVEDATGRAGDDVLAMRDGETGRALGLATPGSSAPREAFLRRRDGTEVLLDATIAPLGGAAGTPAGVVVVLRDRAERRRLDREIAHADQRGTIGTFTACQEPVAPRAAPPRHGHVLVIDDDPFMRSAMRRVLAADHTLTCPSSAREALALIDSGVRFDLILCDVLMPDLGGMELHRALRERHQDQADRMVFVTADVLGGGMTAFLRSVPNGCLEKPFTPDQLQRLVRDALAEHPRGTGGDPP